MFKRLTNWFFPEHSNAELGESLGRLRERLPIPVFWLFGRTQSGKTTLIKYLTGADAAEIGKGFEPCTRFSRRYQFPTAEAPIVNFLDTRGLDEPGYDAAEDLATFDAEAHVLVVVVKALDHGQENVLRHLRTLHAARRSRPVLLVLTCLHEAYPQQQHPQPYPFNPDGSINPADPPVPEELARSLDEQRRRFAGLFDRVVALDITPPEEGFKDPTYGGEQLRAALIDLLPEALRQTLATVDQATRELRDLFARQAMPFITGYSTLAATAGAIPVPLVDLAVLSGIQSRMLYRLAKLYGRPLTRERYLEVVGALGSGILLRQGVRELVKLIPFVGPVTGSVACGALAGASTYALGKAFCLYYEAVHQGHVPQSADLRRYYHEQLSLAEASFRSVAAASEAKPTPDSPPQPIDQSRQP